MASPGDLRRELLLLSDDEKRKSCEEILQSFPDTVHDALLKGRLDFLVAQKSKAESRVKALLKIAPSVTDENLRMAYKEYSDEVRHYSTVRSALTTFLVAVSLTAFSAYFNRSQSHPFLIVAACVMALAAVAVCFEFSRRTSIAFLRRKRIWKYFAKGESLTELDDASYPSPGQTIKTMCGDMTNYLLLIGLGAVVLAFCYRDTLKMYLPELTLPPQVQAAPGSTDTRQ